MNNYYKFKILSNEKKQIQADGYHQRITFNFNNKFGEFDGEYGGFGERYHLEWSKENLNLDNIGNESIYSEFSINNEEHQELIGLLNEELKYTNCTLFFRENVPDSFLSQKIKESGYSEYVECEFGSLYGQPLTGKQIYELLDKFFYGFLQEYDIDYWLMDDIYLNPDRNYTFWISERDKRFGFRKIETDVA